MNNKNNLITANFVNALMPNISGEQSFDFPSELLPPIPFNNANAIRIHDFSKQFINIVAAHRELMMMYNCAMKQINTKLEILNAEYNERHKRNPINFISTRLKGRTSLVSKMKRLNIPFTIENVETHINDVAGVRVICSYVDDIYEITQALAKQDDVTLIEQKDYISKPKPNGYRSMHLIISVPVFFTDHMKHIKVEVQIRTIAMDFWATLEHEIRYKNQIANSQEIAAELKKCADIIADTDSQMLDIRKKIEISEPTEEEILLEKLKKFDMPMG